MSFVMIMWNQHMEKKKVKLSYMDTGTFTIYVKIEDIYVDLEEDVETRFDTSSYELDRQLPKGKK